MNRDQFDALPPTMQLRALTEIVLDGRSLDEINYGRRPFPPRYDARIGRRGGYQWASETDLEGLKFWLKNLQARAGKGGQYAAKDAKRAKDLERWVAWREWEPRVQWNGQRFDATVKAAPPSNKPQLHEYEQKQQNGTSQPTDDDDVVHGDGGADDDSPYG
jgi:hypothetical protein